MAACRPTSRVCPPRSLPPPPPRTDRRPRRSRRVIDLLYAEKLASLLPGCHPAACFASATDAGTVVVLTPLLPRPLQLPVVVAAAAATVATPHHHHAAMHHAHTAHYPRRNRRHVPRHRHRHCQRHRPLPARPRPAPPQLLPTPSPQCPLPAALRAAPRSPRPLNLLAPVYRRWGPHAGSGRPRRLRPSGFWLQLLTLGGGGGAGMLG